MNTLIATLMLATAATGASPAPEMKPLAEITAPLHYSYTRCRALSEVLYQWSKKPIFRITAGRMRREALDLMIARGKWPLTARDENNRDALQIGLIYHEMMVKNYYAVGKGFKLEGYLKADVTECGKLKLKEMIR